MENKTTTNCEEWATNHHNLMRINKEVVTFNIRTKSVQLLL